MNPTLSKWWAEANAEKSAMVVQLQSWSEINSGSEHELGLNRMCEALQAAMTSLPGVMEKIPCAGTTPEPESFQRFALRLRRETERTQRPILLNGHYDTVYGAEHPFQKTVFLDAQHLRGPGVTDMKGGLIVMLTALKIWEASPLAGSLAWEILITPDEETGSQASVSLLKDSAKRCRFGLIYESAYPDGGFVRTRKGSAVYRITATGRSAHVGRNPGDGRNAILALAEAAIAIHRCADELNVIANLGRFSGGGPLNVVPDVASMEWNLRAKTAEEFRAFEQRLDTLLPSLQSDLTHDVKLSWSGGVMRPPKTVDPTTQTLYDAVAAVANEQGLPVTWRDTGGGSEGSNLAEYGLPNIDNLGVRGGAIHSDQEYVLLDSLPERVALTLGILEAAADERIEL